MQGRNARRREWSLRTIAAAALTFLIPVAAVDAQTAPPPAAGLREAPPAASPTPGAEQARPESPGLINEMGKLFDRLPSLLPPLKSPAEAMDDLNARAREAGDALSRLAKPASMVSGRTICPVAANGTPDCKSAADQLCQSKGYREGKSLNVDAVQACSAKVMIPGRQRKPEDCRTDSFVTSALCQ